MKFIFRTSLFSVRAFLALLVLAQVVLLQPAKVAEAARNPVPLSDGAPQLILTKTVDDNITTAQVGDVIRYRIRWECSSLTTSCGQMEITDVLQSGLEYLPPPNSSVPGGFEINYNGVTRTVTITKTDNNLLDGSQYDAVIAVRVSMDFRPLPTTINNTVNGRIDPPGPVGWTAAAPASAPPINIGPVSPSWALTKTRVAPVIEPTVDTDVTYQLRLCPVPPPSGGIAALTNIVLTDTLPAGAVFVSASGGGTFSGGVVTWPTVPGPLYPPDCLTRLVTMRYPSPPFNIGDSLTNSANLTSTYTDSNGNVLPFAPGVTQITHDIIDPVVVPTYSKSDAGDPVGITGTARFILNLNTNLTNYPANAVTLIDTLPPELRVTSVTSGAWSADFDYVRAYVEYSTNYGATWTAFPGQPVLYNTNATYTAPVANITSVRWRFEHDWDGNGTYEPGLPYVWQFTSNPEIRITPRAVATVADPPSGAPMPAATIGSTYTNCVQVSRVGSSGPVTDPCATEDMTVRGDYASLRVSKAETPGISWDEWDNPNINPFTADATILPGDTLRYTLTVDLTERSSAPLINPTILDTLPADLVFVRAGDIRVNGTLLSAAYPTATVNFTRSGPNPGAGQTLLWEINNLTIPQQTLGSQVLTLEFFARIPRGQLPGTRTNTMFVVTDSLDVLCEIGTQTTDGSDVDGDGNNAESACQNTDTYVVDRSAALRGEKWIRSVAAVNSQVVNSTTFLPDASCPNGGTAGLPGSSNPFTRFPCISQAYPEGALNPGQYATPPPGAADLDDFEYQLRIFNDGNVPMLNYVLYDILPFYGDRGSGGTLFNSPRESEFRPVLTGPIQFLGGAGLTAGDFTVEYNLTTNPCRPEVFNQSSGTIPAGCSNAWISSAATAGWTAADWATVRSYRIRLNSGITIAPYVEGDPTNMLRFGMPMSIPADSPVVGVFNNDDAQSREIAWNSFSHVGSYQDLFSNIRDLLASEPRKVGITIPERFSIGNRVWRDSDNSGTINPPDDTNPGIPGVLVHLYLASNTTTPIATTTTDSGGYYLFSNLPAGDYVVGIPASNFTSGQPLYTLRSSTGTPASATYTNPPDGNPDSADHGIDPAVVGQEVFSPVITLSAGNEPVSESDLSANPAHGPAGTRRGLNGERDHNSDLTVDFGFFGGSDIPFSIGNHLWFDTGAGGGTRNDGIRQASEPPVIGARVDLYRDGNLDGNITPDEWIRFDITDSNGFYLFDNLDPGNYFVVVSAGNFTDSFDPDGAGPLPAAPGVLRGWYSSQPTGTELVGVNGGSGIADIDSDDNGINTDFPEVTGVRSGVIVLARGVNEPLGETHLSGQPDPGFPANAAYNPTGWDGPNSRGRFGETDENSNLTIDFGFIPPMSLGNRVWFDSGAGEPVFRSQYNNGLQDGTEPGVPGVRVELWRDNGDGVFNTASDTFLYFTTTDAQGYYLFQRLQPGNYFVHIPASNFASGQPLNNYISSYDRTPPADDATDQNDNGIDAANPASTGVTSPRINMAYDSEPLTPGNETDINNSGVYGPNNRGTYGQADSDSNLTIDFGFVRPPRSLGNYLWFDTGAGANTNNGIFDAGEQPVIGARVSLYLDTNNDGVPDGPAVAWDVTDSNGYYLFDNLPPARYIIGVDADNFDAGGTYSALLGYTSSTNHVDNATNNTDSRDNGRDPLNPTTGYGVLSTTINLTALPLTGMPTGETPSGDTSMVLGFNPTAGDGPNSRGRYGETDANSDLTIDFGFVEAYALGNRVWFDTNNNSLMDAGEVGVNNVLVALYHANSSGNPTTPVLADGVARTATTNADGYYLFDYLAPGDYVVVLPASNFTGAGRLVGYWSSATTRNNTNGNIFETQAPDPDLGPDGVVGGGDDDRDLDDNGQLNLFGSLPGAVASRAVTLGPNGLTEPTDDNDRDPVVQHGNQPNGRSNLTVDFGFYRGQIGNLVFEDVNLNGVYDAGDVVIAGATVQLYQRNNTTLIATATTDASGLYLFNGLPQGEYIVRVTGLPAALGVMVSTVDDNPQNDNDNPNWNVDNNDNGIGTGLVPVTSPTAAANLFVLTPGGGTRPDASAKPNVGVSNANGTTTDLTVDFGFVRAYSLGNRVWFDTNNNGTLDAGEIGINGVRVELYRDTNANGSYDPGTDAFLTFTTTANNGGVPGYYRFDNLFPGEYLVVIPADNFRNVGVGDTVPGDPLRGYWSSRTSWDSAAGVPVEVAPLDPDTDTDNDDNGATTFLPASVNHVASYAVTLGNQAEPTNDNDPAANPQAGEAPNNRSNRTVDFGFYRVEIGNLVFRDNDRSGHFNAGDTPTPGIPVRLYDSAGNQIPVGPDGILGTADDAPGGMLTNALGLYLFSGLPAGSYRVEITLPGGVTSTIDTNPQNDNDNPNWNVDNNDNGDGLGSGVVSSDPLNFLVMTPGGGTRPDASAKPNITVNNANGTTTDNTLDFGFIDLVAIGNRVWLDTGATPGNTNNGRFDTDEFGRNGVTVILRGAGLDGVFGTADDITQTTVTAGGGYYYFDSLIPGLYYVEIPASQFQPGGPLEGYLSSTGAGANEVDDENVDENGIDTTPANPPAVVGVRTQDYNLQPNSERTGEGNTGYTGVLPDASTNFTADFGFVQAYSLGNRVWFDTNNNSVMDTGEQPVENVIVELYRANASGNPTGTALYTATTNAGGYYLFDYLTPGNYVVVLPASNFTGAGRLVGYWSSGTTMQASGTPTETLAPDPDDNPADADDNGTRTTLPGFNGAVISQAVTLGPDGNTEPTGEAVSQLDPLLGQGAQPDARANMTVDFGFYRVSVGNLVYTDGNENGNYDGGPLDAPLPGITVRLYAANGTAEIPVGPDGILGTADDAPGGVVTDAGGNYRFDGLPQGDYIVRVVAPPSTTSSRDDYNAADSADPNTNADDNDNGLGTGAGTVSSAVFPLTPGSSGALNNNTVDQPTGSTHNPTIDFGFIPQYALGNRVWYDTNNNRQIDTGEVGIDGVTVQLYAADASGNPTSTTPLATTTTVNGGYYLFNNLASGDYVVVLPASNFAGVLNGYWSSGTTRNDDGSLTEIAAPDPDGTPDVDSDDNGQRNLFGTLPGAVASRPVTLGLGPVEPTGETDLDGGTQGQPDAWANMTVDFGFYTIRLGNQVWNDANNNGLLDSGETGMDGVTVQLHSADGATLLATTTTAGGGLYTFSGLPQGNYIVRLPEGNFQGTGALRDYYSSTGGGAYEPAPNPDLNLTDSDDNGTEVGSLGYPGGYIQSGAFALTPTAEQTFDNANGSTTEFRVDFGVYNQQRANLSVTKDDGIGYYLPGGTLTYTIIVRNDGPSDVTGAVVTDNIPTQILSWEWVCSGTTGSAAGCDGYGPGNANFTDTVNLPVNSSITYTVNVTIASGATGTLNNTVTITPPTGIIETDPSDNSATDSDRDAILSIEKDDGLTTVAPGSLITYTLDIQNLGAQDLTAVRVTDTLPAEVTFQSAVPAPTSAPAPGTPGGTLEWTGISLASGASATITVTARVNDNAVGPTLLNSVTVADDAIPGLLDSDDDIDIVASSNGKTITGTDIDVDPDDPAHPAPPPLPRVLIGEVITYQVSLDIPAGATLTNLRALDILDSGLAFVDCIRVDGGALTTTLPGGFADACNDPVNPIIQAEPVGSPSAVNQGRRATFNFGDVTNPSATNSETLFVTYEVVVLDIAANVNGVSGLNNSVLWTWNGGSLAAFAPPLEIIEPDLSIDKSAEPLVLPFGSPVTFSLYIAHTPESRADAYDVIATDVLPVNFEFIPGSVQSIDLAPTSFNYNSATRALTFFWDVFPLGRTSTLTFQAVFVGPAPATNTTNVEWTSLPIDPQPNGQPVSLSDYNDFANERWYDPADPAGINNYGASSSITITAPSVLPATGFAPNRVTQLPQQPAEKAYANLGNMWLEIPALGLKLPITGVPLNQDGWDLTWLSNQAGYLTGTTFPGQVGTTGLTAHVTLADGTPGPFRNLDKLYWGNTIILHADGYRYTYEVREMRTVLPSDFSVFKKDGYTWLTLITCKGYVPWLDTYNYRYAVRAVLLKVEHEGTTLTPSRGSDR